mmetsp:Transcript_18890/g.26822  ORF Transcript_18890/g.26822 Transcript_18890/m.26822 type:complete len:103 (+) Transcript_18890:187-495(+)
MYNLFFTSAVWLIAALELLHGVSAEGSQPLLRHNRLRVLTEWPECVSMGCDACKSLIQGGDPSLELVYVAPNSVVTMDYVENRVRIVCDFTTDTVPQPPNIG